ncbi:pyridoxal-dependent decarboxylase [Shigella flexneri]
MPTFGVTYTGNYEFPQPLHDALENSRPTPVSSIDMHIDAASGGSCTVRRPGYRLGLPPAACELDQCFRP